MNQLTTLQAVIATVLTCFVMIFLRAFPFVIFSKIKPPKALKFVEKYIPVVAIAVLFTVCLKEKTTDLIFNSSEGIATEFPKIISAIISATVSGAIFVWKKNSMLSIFGGTILYMVLIRIF